MAGDHSNVGDWWPEQQLAEISLELTISRLDALGFKFDPSYFYCEHVKTKGYVKRVGSNKPDDQGLPYPPGMSPRQWGEGMCALISPDDLLRTSTDGI